MSYYFIKRLAIAVGVTLVIIQTMFLMSWSQTKKNKKLSTMLDAALILEKEIELHPQFRGLQIVKIDPNDPLNLILQ